MKNFDAYMSLAYGAVTRAGDHAARERVVLHDTEAAKLKSVQCALVSARKRSKRRVLVTIAFRIGCAVAVAAVLVAMLYVGAQP